MKKCRICAMFMFLVVVMMLFSACSRGESTDETSTVAVTDEQIIQALKNNGFSDAHVGYNKNGGKELYIDANEKTNIYAASEFVNFWDLESTTDIAKLLNAVMPLYDSDFSNDGSKIVMELRNSRRRYSKISNIEFNGYRYNEILDETNTFAKEILVWSTVAVTDEQII